MDQQYKAEIEAQAIENALDAVGKMKIKKGSVRALRKALRDHAEQVRNAPAQEYQVFKAGRDLKRDLEEAMKGVKQSEQGTI